MAGLINVRVNVNHQALDGVIARLPAGQEFIADAGADATVARAQVLVHKITGHLHDSIHKVGLGAARAVVAEAPYAGYEEFGTRYRPAHPYMRPAIEGVKWGDILREFFKRIGL